MSKTQVLRMILHELLQKKGSRIFRQISENFISSILIREMVKKLNGSVNESKENKNNREESNTIQ